MTEPTRSPFLPGTNIQFAWSSMTIGLLKECPRKYQYSIIEGWGSRDESIHLRFGIEYHQALQDYAIARSEGMKHEDAIHECIRALHNRVHDWSPDRTSRAGRYKNRETIMGLVIDYLDHFGEADPAETYILEDGKPAVELSFRFELDWGPRATAQVELPQGWGPKNMKDALNPDPNRPKAQMTYGQPYLLCGHLDRVVDFAGDLYVMDRKTSVSTIGGYWMDQWTPSNQMTLYTLAGKIMLNSPVKGVIIDAAQVLLEKPNAFARGFAYRTEDQLTEWLADLRYFLREAEDFATADYWPMNDTACTKYGGCTFKEICSKSPQIRETLLKASFDQTGIENAYNPFWDRGGR